MSFRHANPTQPLTMDALVHWLSVEDPEWLGDALWVRYTQLQRQKQLGMRQQAYKRPFAEVTDQRELNRALILPPIPPTDSSDHLSALPYDLRLEIISFLLIPHLDKKQPLRSGGRHIERLHWTHAYSQLALVNQIWRDQVEAFCGHQLIVWKQAVSTVTYDAWEPWRLLRTYTSCARMELVVRLLLRFLRQDTDPSRQLLAWAKVLPSVRAEPEVSVSD